MHNAISAGNLFVVRALLSIGSDIEKPDRKKRLNTSSSRYPPGI
jgi:ankyrin repeat protein